MVAVCQFVAILAASLFTGAAIYVSLVEHPARLECGTELAATVFGPSYRRGTVMQVILALAATLAGVFAWLGGGGFLWLGGALLIFAVVPFTLLAILPTNRRLLDRGLDRKSEAARRLLHDWGRLHVVRVILSGAASIVFLRALIWP